ncbi:MAG: hypothetical protein EP329_06675 [Deltaproteobacteria bacterium]|nr:MAG: hypothetical protein EP329_06675 [Deltaproteobacteria bacterium]
MLIPYLDSPFSTDDGWELRVFRSPPPLGGDALGRPVLMLPGMSANRFSFGLRPGTSLAGALNAAGRDVWILEFRGAASSSWRGRGRPVVDLDRKLRYDLPAAIRTVRTLTGAATLDLVGHSLGGLFAYLHLGGPGGGDIERAVTIAAPGSFTHFLGRGRALLHLPLRVLAPVARQLSGFGLPTLARTAGPLPHLVALRAHFHLGGVDVATQRAWLDHAVEDLPGGDLAQILTWGVTGRLRARNGDDYTGRLAQVRHPILVVASAGDKLVTPAIVRAGYAQLASAEKRFLVVGRDHGASRDYGHACVLLSNAARRDVFQPIVRWLAADTAATEPAREHPVGRLRRARATSTGGR